jgi:hypothetical protein
MGSILECFLYFPTSVNLSYVFPVKERKIRFCHAFLLLVITCLLTPRIKAQRLAEDTITFLFRPAPSGNITSCVAGITDSRNVPPSWVATFSKKKLLIIPVDVLYCNEEPLAKSLKQGFPSPSGDPSCYYLDIRDLSIRYRTGWLFPAFILSAIIPVYHQDKDSLVLAGSLVYNNDYKKLKREKYSAACPRILYSWYPQFQADLDAISRDREGGPTSAEAPVEAGAGPPPGERLYWMERVIPREERMHLSVSGTLGLNWWQTEAEIWFTGVETQKKWVYTTSILRYQNHRDFECMAIGKGIEHLRYRLNPRISYDGSFSLLVGINKWKNLKETQPTLFQIPQLNISSVQSLVLAASNRRGLFLRIGVQGNLYYIFDKNPVFQAGLYLGAGYAL